MDFGFLWDPRFPLGGRLMPYSFSWGQCACLHMRAQLCLTLCDPVARLSVHGILQATVLECVAISTPGDIPDPGMEPMSPVSLSLAGGFFTTGKPSWAQAELLF